MKKFAYFLIAGIVAAALGSLTYSKEYQFRYHLDTLRKERFSTTRIIGIPVARSEGKVVDQYGDIYTRITGVPPDASHWKVMPPDYIKGFNGGFRCHNYGIEFHTRRQVLGAVFDEFKAGMPRDTAAELIRRIDTALPIQQGNRITFNSDGVANIRKELGLETRKNP